MFLINLCSIIFTNLFSSAKNVYAKAETPQKP